MFFRFAYVEALYVLMPLLLVLTIYRWYWHRSAVYTYPLTSMLLAQKQVKKTYYKTIFFLLRMIGLVGLALLVARPQMVDESSVVNIDGVDIVLALDVSGSMQVFDDLQDRRTRFQVAKDEAIRFIDKRANDQVGLVIFAGDVLSRSPLTLDKHFLKEIVGSMELGIIDAEGTFLCTGLAMAVNRLKNSPAKSKVVVLLTDGHPTHGEKITCEMALELAKKCGVKVYSIGIGSDKGAFVEPRPGYVQQIGVQPFNKELLTRIAQQTGGQFFQASKPADMRMIYDTIDNLEKTAYQTNVFHRYYELFLMFIWIVLGIIGVELLLRSYIWRGIF